MKHILFLKNYCIMAIMEKIEKTKFPTAQFYSCTLAGEMV